MTLVVLGIVVLVVVLLLAVSAKIASEHERAVIFRLGRLLPELRGPGLFLVIPLIDRVVRVDLLKQTPAEAVGAHRFIGEKVTVEDADTVRIATSAPWPARSASGAALVPGTTGYVESVEDDLTLVIGSNA